MTTWFTPKHVAAALELHVDTVRRLAHEGEFPGARKFGGEWRIPATALEPDTSPKPLIAPPSKRSLAQQRRRTA